jgi:RNA polymerase sigma factor (sigma-70 family)
VDDVLQDVWLRAFRALGTLQEPAAVGPWLVVMTRRESLRTLQRCVDEFVSDDHSRFDRPVLTTPETELLARERAAELRAAIAALPTRQRRVIGTMLAVPGASYEEVAHALGLPVGSLGPTRGRALVRLRRDPRLVSEASS